MFFLCLLFFNVYHQCFEALTVQLTHSMMRMCLTQMPCKLWLLKKIK